MNFLLDNLLDVLNEEMGFYRQLILSLQKEKKAVVDSKIEVLNEAGKEKENQLLKIRILEEERVKIIEELACKLGHPCQEITLSELSQIIKEPYAERLSSCCSNLKSLLQSIQEINQDNKMLITHSIELVKGSLNLLNQLAAPNSIYCRTGRVKTNIFNGKLLSGEI